MMFSGGAFSYSVVVWVRSARSAGPGPKRLRKTVSVSFAPTIMSFQFWCTGLSAAETMRVPIWTPSAPSAKAAAMVRPSVMPPAAITGRSVFEQTSGSRTMVATSRAFLNPPPSPPSTTSPSTPASMAFVAAAIDGTTWKTVRPSDFSASQYLLGSPAEVVTNLPPWSATNLTMSGSRTNAWATLMPHGLSVRVRIFLTSSFTSSRRPEEVSMIPKPPALDTAEASCARAIQPIGACTIGYLTPSKSVMRFFMASSGLGRTIAVPLRNSNARLEPQARRHLFADGQGRGEAGTFDAEEGDQAIEAVSILAVDAEVGLRFVGAVQLGADAGVVRGERAVRQARP